MAADYKIIDITPSNVDEYDLFCKKTSKNKECYIKKLDFFKKEYKNGLRVKLLHVKEPKGYTSRGFIEYTPIENSYRAVIGKDYLMIHCLWVVGQWKEKGLGTKLLEECINDAKKQKKAGLAMLTKGKWLANEKIFLKNGFEQVNEYEGFKLLAKKLKPSPNPSFPDFKNRAKKYSKGITVIKANQCPYSDDAADIVKNFASKKKMPFKLIELKTSKEIKELSPTPYGTYALIKDGKLISYCYHLEKELNELIK